MSNAFLVTPEIEAACSSFGADFCFTHYVVPLFVSPRRARVACVVESNEILEAIRGIVPHAEIELESWPDANAIFVALRQCFDRTGHEGVAIITPSLAVIDSEPQIREQITAIFKAAYEQHATDVHFRYRDALTGTVTFRGDRLLAVHREVSAERMGLYIHSVSVLAEKAGMSFDREPKRIEMRTDDGRLFDVRIMFIPSYYGDICVARIHGSAVRDFRIEDYALEPAIYGALVEALLAQHGLHLTSGPQSSGKSSLQRAIIRFIRDHRYKGNVDALAVYMAEQSIEVQVPGVTHTEVSERQSLSFEKLGPLYAKADPDLIVIGEINSKESARIACELGMMGRFTLGTTHVIQAAMVPDRLISLGASRSSVVNSLRSMASQRLVPRLCLECRVKVIAPKTLIDVWAKNFTNLNDYYSDRLPFTKSEFGRFYYTDGPGCAKCNGTGRIGLAPILELLVVTPEMREAIWNDSSSSFDLHKIALESYQETGYVPMVLQALRLVAYGVVSYDDAKQAVF